MTRVSTTRLRQLAGALALAVAGIHLLHPSAGGPALLVYVSAGSLADPRPLLFALGGFALVFGVLLGYQGLDGPWTYLAGIALVVAMLAAYAGWHTALGHGAFWPHAEGHAHSHDYARVVLDHLLADPVAFASKAAEGALLIVLGALFWRTWQ